jgi:hypothetical protein
MLLLRIFTILYDKNTDKISFGPKQNIENRFLIKLLMLCSVFLVFVMYFFSHHMARWQSAIIVSFSLVLSLSSLSYSSILLEKSSAFISSNNNNLEERRFNWIKI